MSKEPVKQKKNKTKGIIVLIVFAIGILSLIGALGGLGKAIKNILIGSFGYYSFVLTAIVLFLDLFFGLHLFRKKGVTRTFIFTVILSIILFVYLQIITTNAIYSTLEDVTISSYISACYAAGSKAAGGALFGYIAYPLLSAMNKYAAIPLAILFFVVLFFALLPLMKTSASEETGARSSGSGASSEKKKKKTGEEPLRLFVERVTPGAKDAAVIKMRRRSSDGEESYRLFDVFDTTPVTTPDPTTVPPARPDRYDPFGGSGDSVPDFEEDYDPELRSYAESRRTPTPPIGEPLVEPRDEGDLPRFMRQATERAHATKKLYGEDNLRGVIPDEPTYGEETPAPKKPPLASTPLVDYSKKAPTPSSFEMIESLEDLKRVTERNASKPPVSLFLGETPIRKVETPQQQDVREEVIPPVDMPRTKMPYATEDRYEPPVDDMIDEAEEDDIPMQEETPFRPTITPREASAMQPTEPKPSYFVPSESQRPEIKAPMPDPEPEDDLDDAPILRTRKPRSDIGGTHRSPESIPPVQSSYIPPKQAEQVDIEQAMEEEIPSRPYVAPPVDMLTEYPPMQDEEGVEELGETLVSALASFNIRSEIIDHKTGPTFTQFAVTLPDNMSVNKLMPLEKDIKRKLKIEKNIRIVPSVPGLDAIGIEVPKKNTSIIGLRSMINAPEFDKENKLYFAIGVDVSGRAIYGDLLKMPHLLVAGSTGSGKSVCLNVLICSMLYHYSPDTVRFIMIDPKMVELTMYQNIPHMVMPNTIIDVGKAINALTWAVNEMDRRYALFRENHCRNIFEYNEIQKKNGRKKMYYIVVIVDEMADLMSRAKRDVEDKIQSITSKARSAGIHLVIATQRPSVDVITGTIKNNIPTRIAFKVTSMNDSRTILDGSGAESLFGNGDMLFCPADGGEPVRLQGPFLSDETLSIVEYIKAHNDCSFDAEAEKFIFAEKSTDQDPSALPTNTNNVDEDDPLFADALLFVIQSGQASISKLQRKYRIGYSRAARIVDQMEEKGFIGPTDASNKPRAVLITEQEYFELFGDDGIQGAEGQ